MTKLNDDDPAALRHQIIEATDPNFIWGALDNVHDADTTLDDYAAAVSRAIRAALLSAVQRALTPGWQTIKTAPRDGAAILATGLDHGMGPGRHYSIVKWMDFGSKTGWYPYEDDIPLTYLTHWMPLPAPPSEGVEP